MYTGSLKPTTNRQTWSEIFELFDDETNEAIDLTGATVVMQFREQNCCTPRVSASITIVDTGKFEARIELDTMRSLCPQTYDVGCTIERDGETVEIFVGTIAVVDGVVK